MKHQKLVLACIVVTAIYAGAPLLLCAADKPNIVLLFIDDWAWNGSPIAMDDSVPNSRMPVLQMPNVERLAREGMRFSNAYASPQCSPSRVCVQTGQSSPRNGFTVFMNDRGQDYFDKKGYPEFPVIPCVSDMTIDADAVTIPEALKPLGYVSAHIGKWHMRGNPGDEGYVLHDGDTSNTPGNTLPKGANQRLPDDLTDPKLMFSVTEKALGFMSEQARAGQPFYLQISHYAMHEGRECLPATREKYTRHPLVQAYYQKIGKTADTVKRKEDPAIWLGMGEDLDGRIGAVLQRIKELGIQDCTYVVMVADNGYRHKELQLTPGLTQPLHAAKWWVWQGGIRVPMIVKGPGIRPGSLFRGNVVNYDFLPTFVDWAGGDPRALKDIDGVSLASCMAGEPPSDTLLNRNLYFHYPHYRSSMPHSAVVSGTRKLLHFYERPDIPMLFDLSKDTGEVHNIASDHPAEHKQLFDDMMRYFDKVGARIPKLNPDYDPTVYKTATEYEKRIQWGPFENRRPLEEDERQMFPTLKPLTVAIAFLTTALLCDTGSAAASTPDKPKNILFLVSDDLNSWLLGDTNRYAGKVVAPNLTKLAQSGVNFKRAYTAAPVCSPSRTAFFSGVAPWKSGHYHNTPGAGASEPLKSALSLAGFFKRAGYTTAGYGKITHGWDQREHWDEKIGHKRDPAPPGAPLTPSGRGEQDWGPIHLAEEDMNDTLNVDNAIKALNQEHDKPFFIACGTFNPHMPWYVPKKYFDMFPLEEVTTPELLENDLDDVPELGVELTLGKQKYVDSVFEHGLHKDGVQAYLATTAYVDAQMGRVLDALEKSPHRDNTVVVFLTDHGFHLAEKHHWQKATLWEEATHSLLMIRAPGVTPADGAECERFVSLLDIYPTLAELCGLEPPDCLDGRSLVPLLRDPEAPWRSTAITGLTSKGGPTWYPYLSIRNETGRYIRYVDGQEEFYDTTKDPHEWSNAIDDPEYASVIERMRAAIPKPSDVATPLPATSAAGW